MDTTYIIDGNGKRREAVLIHCDNCGKHILKLRRFLKRVNHNFCDSTCCGE